MSLAWANSFTSRPLATIASPGRHELTGAKGAPVILALGGISADRHISAHPGDARAGWWSTIAGEGRALDAARYQLLGVDYRDGGVGRDGRPVRIITTHEQADAIAELLEEVDIARLHAVIGASYGGMVALAFAERYPQLLERLVVIGAAHVTHPLTTAWRVTQRRVVELGLATGRARDALILARGLAMTTYRSAREFGERFTNEAQLMSNDATFPVESYLRHQGERFAARFTPARFLALSLSSDLHTVDPTVIRTPTVVVAQENDLVVPREQTIELARTLGGPSRFVELPSVHGHDAFLTEPTSLGAILDNALQISVAHE